MKVLGFAQVALAVGDLDRSERFYSEVLGLTRIARQGHTAIFECGPIKLVLDGSQGDGIPTAGVCHYLRVERIEPAAARLKSHQVAFEMEPSLVSVAARHDLWMAFFRDPDDHLWALMEERPSSPPPSRSASRQAQ